jgi:NAD+--asparagine ADP-ribosyltransferase
MSDETRKAHLAEGTKRMAEFVSEVYGASEETMEMLSELTDGLAMKAAGVDMTTVRDPKLGERNGMTFHGILSNVGGIAEWIASDYDDVTPIDVVTGTRQVLRHQLDEAARQNDKNMSDDFAASVTDDRKPIYTDDAMNDKDSAPNFDFL